MKYKTSLKKRYKYYCLLYYNQYELLYNTKK